VETWLGQYCIEVSDLDASVERFEALGLTCTSRTTVAEAFEAIVENPAGGSSMQLAQRTNQPFRLGNAFWKLYVNARDIESVHRKALEAGCDEVSPPASSDRWPVAMSFVSDPDGYLIEIVERRPWQGPSPEGPTWLGQYCLNVTDLERTVALYELMGLLCTSRTDIEHALEAIVEQPGRGSKLQLAQHLTADPITGQKRPTKDLDMGSMWKLYVNTDDCQGLHDRVVEAGCASRMAPMRLDRWPVTVGFIEDPDGYQIELVQRDAR
jgi:lactoylglutathione lyase